MLHGRGVEPSRLVLVRRRRWHLILITRRTHGRTGGTGAWETGRQEDSSRRRRRRPLSVQSIPDARLFITLMGQATRTRWTRKGFGGQHMETHILYPLLLEDYSIFRQYSYQIKPKICLKSGIRIEI